MHIYKFSLPEGCDLSLQIERARAHVRVTYKGEFLHPVDSFILGQKISLRRGILGTSFVVDNPAPVRVFDLVSTIKDSISLYNSVYGDLNRNLKHLEGMPINPATMDMIRAQAQQTVRQTTERMLRENTASPQNYYRYTRDTIGELAQARTIAQYDQAQAGSDYTAMIQRGTVDGVVTLVGEDGRFVTINGIV